MASKNWKERLNLSAFTDEAQEEYLRARRRRGFSQPLIFVLVIVASVFILSLFFRVEDIRVEGNVHYTDEEIIRAIDIEEGDNLFFFDRFAAISRVFSKLPYIEEVSLHRALPNRITISVQESTALAYLILGDEEWTMDHNCKILGKAAQGETDQLVPIVNFNPGTLFIGERLTTANGEEDPVNYLNEILLQIDGRNMIADVDRVDFESANSPELVLNGRFTVVLGRYSEVQKKFAMLAGVLDTLKEGDAGVINLADGQRAYFSPN
ncbi:MAG: FtsQ-type POTRA domain-containing protein [Oscillospiraceae bacterium]|nr:FtsQ-type POTRA domain-containing protein [Oscillospiraceae bacterium]